MKVRGYTDYTEHEHDFVYRAPSHWHFGKLGYYIADLVAGGTPPRDDMDCWADKGEGIPWVTIGDLTRVPHVKETEQNITEHGRTAARLRVLPIGTILYSIYATLGKAAVLNLNAATNQAILGLRPRPDALVSRYLLWWLRALEPWVKLRASSNTQDNLSAQRARELPLLIPSIPEQEAIAQFLDHETARIDALIKEQKRLVGLIQEKRRAVVVDAVTKGLRSNVAKKDSGVDWLGRVPEHWTVAQIRYKARLESGHTPSRSNPEFWTGCTIPWFTLADVWQIRQMEKRYVYETNEMINELGVRHSSARLLPAGSVILSRTASVGFPAILGREMAVSQDFAVWIPGQGVDREFLWYVLRGMRNELWRLMMGSTHQTIYMPDIKILKAAFPTKSEQREIVEYLDTVEEDTERLLGEMSKGVELLGERRASLILSAVTGKIDVRDWKPEDWEEGQVFPQVAEQEAPYG